MTSDAPELPPAADAPVDTAPPDAPDTAGRKRPKPGERRVQILQALAAMLEQPGADRITTAALAARLVIVDVARQLVVDNQWPGATWIEGLDA